MLKMAMDFLRGKRPRGFRAWRFACPERGIVVCERLLTCAEHLCNSKSSDKFSLRPGELAAPSVNVEADARQSLQQLLHIARCEATRPKALKGSTCYMFQLQNKEHLDVLLPNAIHSMFSQ